MAPVTTVSVMAPVTTVSVMATLIVMVMVTVVCYGMGAARGRFQQMSANG